MANGYKKVITLGLDYSEFTGGMKQCNSEMKKLDSEYKAVAAEMQNSSTNTDRFAQKSEYLSKKIELQSHKVNLAKQKLDELKGSQNASTEAINRAETAYNNERASLANLQNELDGNVVAMSNWKAALTASIAVLTAVGMAVKECVMGVAEYSDELQTLSDQTGVSVESLQAWDYASELIDTDFTTMTNSFRKLEKSMANSPDAFEKLGVSITDASGHMRSAEAVFYDTIDALGDVENATEQDQMAMEIFGKSAADLTGVINAGSSGLEAYKQEAKEMGLIMSDEDVAASNELADAMYRVQESFQAAKNEIGSALAPALTVIADLISQIPAPVTAAILVVVALTAVIATITIAVGSLSLAFTALVPAALAATASMAPIILTVLAIVAAVTALVLIIDTLVKKYQEWKEAQDAAAKSAQSLSSALNVSGGSGHSRGETGHNATGTSNWRGGMTWVGENGPELVDVPAGSRIYNNNESNSMTSSSTVFNVTIDAKSVDSFNKVVNVFSGLSQSFNRGDFVNG